MKKILTFSLMAFFSTHLEVRAQAALSPFVSSLAESLLKECPKDFKYISAQKHKANMQENIKANGKDLVAEMVKGSRDKIKEKGGCKAAVTDFKTKTKEQQNTLNVAIIEAKI